jgi:hypothetical protein
VREVCLQKQLEALCSELSIAMPEMGKDQSYALELNPDVVIHLKSLDPGVSFHAKLVSCPKKSLEDLFIHLMRANLLGQGTGGARLGLSDTNDALTLSLDQPFELDRKTFKETLENFANYVVYWRDEIQKFESA